jgi:undecaprenyl diphosphate synthase
LPKDTYNELMMSIEETSKNTGTTLILALSYSSRWEIKEALKAIVADAKDGNLSAQDITETTMHKYLCTKDYPDPDLLIRTSGEYRISNFLLWQLAYTELYFTQKLWPDFRKQDLIDAIIDYQGRQRRFGKTGEQVEQK